MRRDEVRKIWEDVKADHARLAACPGPHDFQPIDEPGRSPTTRRVRCRVCGGATDWMNAHWYERGLEHGRQSPSAGS